MNKWHEFHPCFISPAFSSLCYTFVRKEVQRIQLQAIGEPEDHFLDTDGFQLGQTMADRLWIADQRTCGNRATQKRRRDFCSSTLRRKSVRSLNG